MRLNDNTGKRRTKGIRQPFALTSREIMADLMYPAPADAPKAPRGRR